MGGGHEQEFEWDADKAEANLRKHRIAFEGGALGVRRRFCRLSGQMLTSLTVKCGL